MTAKRLIPPAIVVLLGVAVVLAVPLQVPAVEGRGVGPRVLPFTLGGVIAIAGLLELLTLLFGRRQRLDREPEDEHRTATDAPQELKLSRWAVYLVILLVTLLWIYTTEHTGYFLSSSLLVVITAVAFGLRRPIPVILLTIVAVGSSYYVFSELLAVQLPGFGGWFQ